MAAHSDTFLSVRVGDVEVEVADMEGAVYAAATLLREEVYGRVSGYTGVTFFDVDCNVVGACDGDEVFRMCKALGISTTGGAA